MADLAISLCEARVNSELATIAIKEISDALKKKLPTTKPSLKKRGSIGTNSKQQSEVMDTELKLSAPVSISARKYFHNEKLKTISFEKGKKVADVVSLGKSSFEGCPHLEKLIMNDPKRCAVKFGERAMAECPSIVEIDLSNVSVIGKEAFSDCSGLVSVAFSGKKSSVTVYDKAFPVVKSSKKRLLVMFNLRVHRFMIADLLNCFALLESLMRSMSALWALRGAVRFPLNMERLLDMLHIE